MFYNSSVPEYKHSVDDEFDPDESPNCEYYIIDQVKHILGQNELDKIIEKFKLPLFVK